MAVLCLAIATAVALPAHADQPVAVAKTATKAKASTERKHAVYLELLGKGGLWGAGYDYAIHRKIAIGGLASFYVADGERVFSFSPYASLYVLGGKRHRWFVQGGPTVVHLQRPSPVPEWPGMSTTGVGAELSSGYELRTRVLFRAFAMGTYGKGGAAPWLGLSIGATL